MVEMVNNYFYESKNNFLLKREKVLIKKRQMDGEKDELQWEMYYKNVKSKEVFGK